MMTRSSGCSLPLISATVIDAGTGLSLKVSCRLNFIVTGPALQQAIEQVIILVREERHGRSAGGVPRKAAGHVVEAVGFAAVEQDQSGLFGGDLLHAVAMRPRQPPLASGTPRAAESPRRRRSPDSDPASTCRRACAA